MISCSIANLLYVRDSLRIRQTYRMFVKFIANLLIRLYVRQIQNTSNRDWMIRIFFVDVYVFDFRQNEIYTNSLFKMRFIRNRVIVMKYSYEYKKNFILIVNNKIDWFFRFDVLETIYCEKNLHCKMSKSNLIDICMLKTVSEISRNNFNEINVVAKRTCKYLFAHIQIVNQLFIYQQLHQTLFFLTIDNIIHRFVFRHIQFLQNITNFKFL